MTEQAKLKAQAYQSDLKSRALSVLIYLIDRSNKDLTCFPAISTMAKQLHISVSTVKRALRELVEAGYIEKDPRFRPNKGQSSNLYTLLFLDGQDSVEHGSEKNNVERDPLGDKITVINRTKHITFEEISQNKRSMQVGSMEDTDTIMECHIRGGYFACDGVVAVKHEMWTGEEVSLMPP